jgi:hypothetical protein
MLDLLDSMHGFACVTVFMTRQLILLSPYEGTALKLSFMVLRPAGSQVSRTLW